MANHSRATRHSIILFSLLLGIQVSHADDWPQWRGPRRDATWHEDEIIDRFPSDSLDIAWRQPIGSGYSGPTVADGRVFVTDRLVEPKQVERVHCFDWRSGKKIWSHTYDCRYENVSYQSGPRAAVTIDDSRAYSLGTMGHLFCFDAGTGQVLWKQDLLSEYDIRMPIWGIAAAPLVYKQLVILQIGGSNGACVIALNKKDGDLRWKALEDRASYSAPIVIQQAGHDVIVVWTGDSVTGLNPGDGSSMWRFDFPPNQMVIGTTTPVVDRDRLVVSSFYDGTLMLKLAANRLAVEKMWLRRGASERETDALHSMISTPILSGDELYGVDSYGELRCLDAATGDRIWEDQTATPRSRWSTIHMVRNGHQVWMLNERGQLIIAKLSRAGFHELSRAQLIQPTLEQLRQRNGVCWAHPAFAYRHVFARNDEELVCASLEAD